MLPKKVVSNLNNQRNNLLTLTYNRGNLEDLFPETSRSSDSSGPIGLTPGLERIREVPEEMNTESKEDEDSKKRPNAFGRNDRGTFSRQ